MRTLSFRARTAIRLLGFPIDQGELRTLAEKERQPAKDRAPNAPYHLSYTPDEIALVRGKVRPSFHTRKENATTIPPVILTRMSKGGVGKSTITGGLALACAMQGFRILLIDADPQASLTQMVGIDPEEDGLLTLRNLLPLPEHLQKRPAEIDEAARQVYADTPIDFIPSDIRLSTLDMQLAGHPSPSMLFTKFLKKNAELLSARYDLILVDSGPGSSMLNYNLMIGCSLMLCVLWLDGLSIKALNALHDDLEEMRENGHAEKSVMFVANGYHPSYKHTQDSLSYLQQSYPNQLFRTVIPAYAGFDRQGGIAGESHLLLEAEPNSVAAEKLIELSRELLKLHKIPGSEDF